MVRYTYGGDIHDLIARPDANAGGALKLAPNIAIPFYTAASGGTVVTDFLVDTNGDGTFSTSDTQVKTRATGYLPDFKGPDGFDTLYYDPDPTDTDVIRVRLVARDSTTAGAQAASTTAAGVVEYADTTERTTGTATNRVTAVADVTAMIATHANNPNAHPDLATAVDSLQTAMLTKPTLNAAGDVSMDQLPFSTGGTPDMLVAYRSDGSIGVVASSAADSAMPRSSVQTLIDQAAAVSGDVRAPMYNPATPPTSTSATTFTTIDTAAITNAATGQRWRCEYDIVYRGTTAAGIQVRHKTASAAVTNVLSNPSFETDLSDWTTVASTTATRRTDGGQVGTSYVRLTAATASTLQYTSGWYTTTPGQTWTAGCQVRLAAGTAKLARIDLQWNTPSGVVSDLGGTFTPASGTWTAVTKAATLGVAAPADATQVRVKVAYQAPAVGDAIDVDAVQLEPSAPLPAYGSTGGSGSGALTFTGRWYGLTNAATTSDNYSKVTAVRGTGSLTAHGALGTTTDAFLYGSFEVEIGGTGLTNQRIELEFAQRVADATTGNETKIMTVRPTFARIA